jgi:tetratricopeptide (TPR) repeat protein
MFSDVRAVLALQGLGLAHLAQGNVRRAQEYADLSGALASEAQDRWLADCLELAARLQVLRAEWDLALESLTRVLEIRQRVGHLAGIVEAHVHLGHIFERRRDTDAALREYQAGVAVAEQMDAAPSGVAAYRSLGRLLLAIGQAAEGAVHIRHAVALAEAMPDSLEYARALFALVELEADLGQTEAALSTAARALEARHSAVFGVEARVRYAELLLVAGKTEHAEAQASMAMQAAEALGGPLLLAIASRISGEVAGVKGDRARAESLAQIAVQHYQAAEVPHELGTLTA